MRLNQDRKIIHLDMDAFYASIEVRDRPELAGRPVAVGGTGLRGGVLCTCNYEARRWGVRSAMPTFMALEKCPELVLLPVRFEVYRRESAEIRAILEQHTPLVEPLSLDEAYLDVSHHAGDPAALAGVIRQQIWQKTRLTASAGIGPNKLIAKIASDWRKPDGQFAVAPGEVPDFMMNLPVTKIWGIGRVSGEKLERRGIATCGELQRMSRLELGEMFGKFGSELFDLCRGVDSRPVLPDRERRSLGTERTYPADLPTLEACQAQLPALHRDLVTDLTGQDHLPPVVAIFLKVKFADFTRASIDRTRMTPSLDNYRQLLAEAFARTGKAVRLIGIGVRFAAPTAVEIPAQMEFPLG